MIACSECGEIKPLLAKNMCYKCYHKQHHKQYYKNNQEYYKQYSQSIRYKNGAQSMNKNKTCSSYLGVHIAEQVLSKVFKNVQTKLYGHKGYDFICNSGYKIDVKSGCLNSFYNKKYHKNYYSWKFCIKQNKIADYFLCLAFDNRTDLNPEHIWLIPGDILNGKHSINISESKLSKWDEYKLDINKVISCCNILR